MLTSIIVKGLKTYGFHGLFAEERTLGQKFSFDIAARLRRVDTHREDRLNTSVRYDAIVEEACEIATSSRFQTLEALGEAVAIRLLSRFSLLESVVVGVSKLNPPIPHAIDLIGIEVSVSRDQLPDDPVIG